MISQSKIELTNTQEMNQTGVFRESTVQFVIRTASHWTGFGNEWSAGFLSLVKPNTLFCNIFGITVSDSGFVKDLLKRETGFERVV